MYYIPLIFSLQHLKMRFYWASTMDFWIRDFVSSLRSLAEIKVTYLNSFKLSTLPSISVEYAVLFVSWSRNKKSGNAYSD